jgi:cell wall-associated NlpC family hydrolase
VAAAEPAGGRAGAVIAVLTAITESGLRALGNPNVDTNGLPVQGEGTDHDSIGLFQQRGSWGPVQQRLDPVLSTWLFMTRLLTDPDWQAKQPWEAAQDVQVSAYDGVPRAANHYSAVYGGNYAGHAAQAAAIVQRIDADAAKRSCGSLTGGVPAGPASRHGLPPGYVIPSDAHPAEATAIAFALAQLDKPYVVNAAGPDAFDCSGLTMAAWAAAGVHLQHWTGDQIHEGTPVPSPVQISPGDLVLVPGDDGTLANPGHVGMYIGDGLIINASSPRTGIRVQTFDDFVAVGHGLSGIRHVG